MTPLDYDYLRKLLKDRSGLTLSAEKQYLVESRLLPVARKAGGSVIAQDEATSVVWGMPGAAAQAGLCSAVLPLDEIGPRIVRLINGEQP